MLCAGAPFVRHVCKVLLAARLLSFPPSLVPVDDDEAPKRSVGVVGERPALSPAVPVKRRFARKKTD
eukprot:1447854-Lingulodinium_polyedra.AAC.1